MPRYRELSENQMDDAQRRVFNDCKAGPRGCSAAAGACLAAQPQPCGQRAQARGRMSALARSSRRSQTEIAILMTARYWTAQFEWAAHVRLAPRGRAVAGRRSTRSPSAARPCSSDPDAQVVYDFCRDYYDDHRV